MKIAILTQYYKPEMGAPQNRLYEMAVGLKKFGADITVITGMPNYPTGKIFKEYSGKWFCKENLDGIDIFRFWLFASNVKRVLPRVLSMLSFSFSVLFSLKYVRKKRFDFIIVESPPLTLGLSGYFLSKVCKSKMIMNISDLWPLSARELGVLTDGVIYCMLEKLEYFLYKKSVACMGQSQEIVSYISQYGASRTYLFRNGVTPERFQNIPNKKRTNGNLIIVYAGLLGVAQGILEICQKIDFKSLGTEFHIYGAGGEQHLIEEFLLTNSERGISFHGRVSRDEIPSLLKQADVTLIPLVKNIFGAVPSKIYESMAAGVPILFAGEGEGQRIIEENCLGWVSRSRDYEKLIENIKLIRSNDIDMLQKRENCKNAAENLFNRPKQIKALFQYLSQLNT